MVFLNQQGGGHDFSSCPASLDLDAGGAPMAALRGPQVGLCRPANKGSAAARVLC